MGNVLILHANIANNVVIKFDNHVTSQHGGHFESREFCYSPFFIRDFVRSYSVLTLQVPMVLFGKAKELHMFQNGRCVSRVLM